MGMASKIEKCLVFSSRDLLALFHRRACTALMARYYRRHGMKIHGRPNYLSAKAWFDGTDYSQIELGEGCTISSFVRVLTHDWSPYTIARGLGLKMERPIGVFRPVRIGPYAFVGTYSVLLPGADIGRGAVVGAGSTVRGKVEPWTIVVGSPAEPVGDSRDFLCHQLERMGRTDLLEQARRLMEEQALSGGKAQ